jgi:DNA-binding transcriptional LysR family regulator
MTNIVTFVKIAEVGGFAAAARKLGVSASTVTTQIQGLEDRLGVRLLNRSTRKVSLTEIGKAYYERCLHILADMDEADGAIRAMDLSPRGSLYLNVSISIPFLLAPVIAEFTSLYSDVTLTMMMTDRMIDLVQEGIDLAITTLPVQNANLIVRRVGSYRLAVFGSSEYFARHGVPREPDDLANHNCMKYTFSPWGSEWRFRSPHGDGERAVRVAGNMETNSLDALKLAAALGQGLILMPDFVVIDEIKSGKLIPVLTEFTGPERLIHTVYPHRQHLSTNVRTFIDLLAKHCHGPNRELAGGDLKALPTLIATDGRRPSARFDSLNQKPEQRHT